MAMRAVLGMLVIGVMSSSALAQPGMTPPPGSPPVAPAPPVAPEPPIAPASDPTAMPAPEPAPAPEPPMVVKLTMGARGAARDGRCDSIAMIGARVHQIDPAYYQNVFLVDPEIRSCRQGVSMRPPSSPATLTAAQPQAYASVDTELLPSEIVEVKSPGTALALSLGVTAGGLALAWAADGARGDSADSLATLGSIAFLVGPTVGHMYAGNTWNTGLQWRLVSVGGMLGGVMYAFSQCGLLEDCTQEQNDRADIGVAIAVGGLISFGAATVYEVATAGSSARKYNLEYSRQRLQLAPMAGRSMGLSLTGTF